MSRAACTARPWARARYRIPDAPVRHEYPSRIDEIVIQGARGLRAVTGQPRLEAKSRSWPRPERPPRQAAPLKFTVEPIRERRSQCLDVTVGIGSENPLERSPRDRRRQCGCEGSAAGCDAARPDVHIAVPHIGLGDGLAHPIEPERHTGSQSLAEYHEIRLEPPVGDQSAVGELKGMCLVQA